MAHNIRKGFSIYYSLYNKGIYKRHGVAATTFLSILLLDQNVVLSRCIPNLPWRLKYPYKCARRPLAAIRGGGKELRNPSRPEPSSLGLRWGDSTCAWQQWRRPSASSAVPSLAYPSRPWRCWQPNHWPSRRHQPVKPVMIFNYITVTATQERWIFPLQIRRVLIKYIIAAYSGWN